MFNADPTITSFIKFSVTNQTLILTPGLFDSGDYSVLLLSKTSTADPVDISQEVFIQVIPDPSMAKIGTVEAVISQITNGGKLFIDFN
jgi:hypothetical protein